MDPFGKSLECIERRLAAALELDDVAKAAGTSRFAISRIFLARAGRTVMEYVRGRRLSEAEKALVAGAPDILGLTLDAGYGSHEAFTRAFRARFGQTPQALRENRALDRAKLQQKILMSVVPSPALPTGNLMRPVMPFSLLGRRVAGEGYGECALCNVPLIRPSATHAS